MVNGVDAEGGSAFTWSKGPNRIAAGGATPRWVMARDGAATVTVERGFASGARLLAGAVNDAPPAVGGACLTG